MMGKVKVKLSPCLIKQSLCHEDVLGVLHLKVDTCIVYQLVSTKYHSPLPGHTLLPFDEDSELTGTFIRKHVNSV
jgi:hypothetical protein